MIKSTSKLIICRECEPVAMSFGADSLNFDKNVTLKLHRYFPNGIFSCIPMETTCSVMNHFELVKYADKSGSLHGHSSNNQRNI